MHRKPPPADWPQLSVGLTYRDPARAIDWLCQAFGFEVRLRVEGDSPEDIVHSELTYGGALIMVGREGRAGDDADGKDFKLRQVSPKSIEGRNTMCVVMYVDDADAHCAQARAHGAQICSEPGTHDYGDDYWVDRSYGAYDCEGHTWWFSHRVKTLGEPA